MIKRRFSAYAAAILSVLMLSSCVKSDTGWDDTLPSAVTVSTAPEVIIVTEETTTEETVSLPPKQTTSRTAATSPTPELATSTSPVTDEDGTTAVSTIPGIPRVPISEFTVTAPSDFTVPSEDDEPVKDDDPVGYVDDDLEYPEEETETSGTYTAKYETVFPEVKDPFAPYTVREEIQRPYSYGSLSEKHAYVYDAIVSAVENGKTDVNFSKVMNITAEDCQFVYQQLFNDEIGMYYLDSSYKYSVNVATKTVSSMMLSYKLSSAQIKRNQAAIDEAVDSILAGITSDMSQYDIVKYFYDYLAGSIIYDDEADNCTNIYGGFVGKRALCQAYSKGFTYLCNKVGIESLMITGDANDSSNREPHMWNMVKLGGEWYHIDPTFARAESDTRGVYIRYNYFCVSDEMLKNKRDIYEQTYSYPKAVSDKCSYFVHSGLVAKDWDALREMLTEQILKSAKEKSVIVQVRCSDNELYSEAKEKLFGYKEKQAIQIMSEANERSKVKFKTDNISFSYDDDIHIISLYLDFI